MYCLVWPTASITELTATAKTLEMLPCHAYRFLFVSASSCGGVPIGTSVDVATSFDLFPSPPPLVAFYFVLFAGFRSAETCFAGGPGVRRRGFRTGGS